MRKRITVILSVCFLLLIWQLVASYINQPQLIPTIPHLIETLIHLLGSGAFYKSLSATILRGITGIILSLFAGLISAFLFARYELLYELFRPILIIMRSVPVISFILFALIFFNPEGIPLIIAFLTMYPLLTENLTKGITQLRPGFSIMAHLFQINRRNKLLQVIYPQIKPFLFSGLASAAGFGWRAIIMGEVLSQCAFGIGGEMKRAQNFIEVPELIAWTIVAICVSFLFDKGISRLSRIRWNIVYKKNSRKHIQPNKKGNDLSIRMEDISFQYNQTPVISHFSYTFTPDNIYGIKAPSGVGKTTLLNLAVGILKPDKGSIINRNKCIAMVFQEPELLSHLTVLENISLSLASFLCKEDAKDKAYKALEMVEMASFQNRYPEELSYGQQQRIAIARAVAFPASVILMDEPFKGLDETLVHRIITRILDMQRKNKQLILFTSHNPKELSLLATQTIELATIL